MNILHVSCSPRGGASQSHRLAQEIVRHLMQTEPAATVLERHIGDVTLLAIDEEYAQSQQASADVSSAGTASRSEVLIRELESADVVVIGTPMHNFTVPAALKLWIDHVVRVRRTFDVSTSGKVGLLRDRPVLVGVSSGGRFSGQGTRQPDFLTPYLRAILGTIGLHDVTFFSVEGMAFGPAAVAEARAKSGRALQEHFATAWWGVTQ
jgi:FMN-dependent NADH-azoreductase